MNFRRLGKYLCVMSLAATMTITTMGATITDVKTTHWAYAAITDLEERGIMVLSSDGQFKPNQTMNYFELADVIAKATGYVDVDIATNITDIFRQQLKANYEKQKATLDEYASKYKSWNSAYNQQVAYLLGRGYMTKNDLNKFITQTEKGETKNIATKEDLCVYLVRMLKKAETAKSTYKKTNFKDDDTLKAENKPYVAYLASVGIVNADAQGKVNGTMKMTKALCAKMVSDCLKIEDTTRFGKITTNNTNTTNTTNNNASTTNPNTTTNDTGSALTPYTVTQVVVKNDNEYYVKVKDATGKEAFYSLKNSTPITDLSGAVVPVTKLVEGTPVNITLGVQESTTYITSICITGDPTTANTTQNGTTTPTTETNATTVSGTLSSTITNGIIRLVLNDGTSAVKLVKEDCSVSLNGVPQANTDALKIGDLVTVTMQNNVATQIVAMSGTNNNQQATTTPNNGTATNTNATTTTTNINNLNGGEVTAKKYTGTGYVLTLKQGNMEGQITIPTNARVTRNGRTVNLFEVRIGDLVKFTSSNNAITEVAATGEKKIVEGTIKALSIGGTSKVTLNVKGEEVTYNLASDTEYYDNNTNNYINIRDLHIGQEVVIALESKEVITLDVEKNNESYKYMGKITSIGRGGDYIQVLVDYDYLTGESKVYKNIQTPSNLVVEINGQRRGISSLDEDMDIVVYYKYLDDTVPESIQVLSK